MDWTVMDVADMEEYEDDFFDLAVDKSTIDAVICGHDPLLKVSLMLKEV